MCILYCQYVFQYRGMIYIYIFIFFTSPPQALVKSLRAYVNVMFIDISASNLGAFMPLPSLRNSFTKLRGGGGEKKKSQIVYLLFPILV